MFKRLRSAAVPVVIFVAGSLVYGGPPAQPAILVDPTTMAHSEPLYTLDHPNYGSSASSTNTFDMLNGEASRVRHEVMRDATAAHDEALEQLVRDCANQALANTARNIWYVIANGGTLDVQKVLTQTGESCLNLYAPGQLNATSRAATFASAATAAAESVFGVEPDLYGLADWLQVVDYYYIPA
jgi:hypothetical protein